MLSLRRERELPKGKTPGWPTLSKTNKNDKPYNIISPYVIIQSSHCPVASLTQRMEDPGSQGSQEHILTTLTLDYLAITQHRSQSHTALTDQLTSDLTHYRTSISVTSDILPSTQNYP